MHDLNDLYYYVQIVDHGGFAQAGRALGISKSTLSRRIAQLEERLGVRLLQRSTRRFAVTDIGHTYYQHCKAMLVEAQAAQEAIDIVRADPQGIVRLSCPIALLHADVGAMLADFMRANPRVQIHLEATNRPIDLISESIDVALRARRPPLADSELILRVLARRSQCLVASPALVQQQGQPTHPEELGDWPSLSLGPPQENHRWTLVTPSGEELIITHQPRFVTSDMTALRQAAVTGVGVVQLPTMLLREQLADGTLVQLLPDWRPPGEVVHAVFPSRRGLLPAVRSLVDFLAMRYAELGDD